MTDDDFVNAEPGTSLVPSPSVLPVAPPRERARPLRRRRRSPVADGIDRVLDLADEVADAIAEGLGLRTPPRDDRPSDVHG